MKSSKVEIPRRDLKAIARRLNDALAKINVYLDATPADKFVDEGGVFAYTNSRGRTYFLHGSTTLLKSGKQQTIYFFGKEIRDGALGALPVGFIIRESKNGLPVVIVGSEATRHDREIR